MRSPTRLMLSALAVSVLVLACSKKEAAPAGPPQPPVKLPSGLEYQILVPGTGDVAKPGDKVEVHYVGTLEDGTKFDSSRDRDKPFPFRLGAGQVIAGWDQGVAGMREGEKRRLRIPPELGYGSSGTGPIPPNSTLIFEVELIDVR